jgi:hypothetical protein
MGTDIYGIIKHNLTPKQVINLPKEIDTWQEIKRIKKKDKYMLSKLAKYDGKELITEKSIVELWDCFEKEEPMPPNLYDYSNIIDCFIGWVKVYRKTVVINQFPEHKYGNMHYPNVAKKVIEINRIIAKKLGSDEIVYCPDSAFPTAIIEEYAREGKSIEEIKMFAIGRFGEPPKGIDEGRKYMFFIDNINEEIGEIAELDDWEEYWKYNNETRDYELVRKN